MREKERQYEATPGPETKEERREAISRLEKAAVKDSGGRLPEGSIKTGIVPKTASNDILSVEDQLIIGVSKIPPVNTSNYEKT